MNCSSNVVVLCPTSHLFLHTPLTMRINSIAIIITTIIIRMITQMHRRNDKDDTNVTRLNPFVLHAQTYSTHFVTAPAPCNGYRPLMLKTSVMVLPCKPHNFDHHVMRNKCKSCWLRLKHISCFVTWRLWHLHVSMCSRFSSCLTSDGRRAFLHLMHASGHTTTTYKRKVASHCV